MRAIVLREVGPCESLRLEEVADPTPGPGEVVVRLQAAALNHRDIWIRKGQYAKIRFPAILGSDGAGTVESVGEGVDSGWVGRSVVIDPGLGWGDDPRVQGPDFRVLGMPDDGTYAEFIRIPVESVHDQPAHLSAQEAAAVPLAGLTAYRALVTRARLCEGETVLITGIGGGVAGVGLLIAKALGARVVVSSRSDRKLEQAAAMGADACLNSTNADWGKMAVKLAGGEGPHVVLDSVGGETFARALAIVRPGGRIVTFGATTGPVERLELTRLFWKQLDLLGSTMGNAAEFAAMLALIDKQEIHPPVSRVFPLAEAAEAHRFLESSEQFGKVVLDPIS
jgi:zinc-binding alcohol dehydrogenase/oxidoreductase